MSLYHTSTNLHAPLAATIEQARSRPILPERKEVLQPLIAYLQEALNQQGEAALNFICTHNSRRSQFAQVWGQTAAAYFGLNVQCYSGGVEVTAFNHRAIETLQNQGFNIRHAPQDNPHYYLAYSTQGTPIKAFSKLFDDSANPAQQFAAVMTCSHADENCPFIAGADQRIPVRYNDPKAYDDTPQESSKYNERSLEIASELFFVFAQIQTA